MNQTHDPEIRVLEQPFHDPHDIRQDIRFRIETSHHQWYISC